MSAWKRYEHNHFVSNCWLAHVQWKHNFSVRSHLCCWLCPCPQIILVTAAASPLIWCNILMSICKNVWIYFLFIFDVWLFISKLCLPLCLTRCLHRDWIQQHPICLPTANYKSCRQKSYQGQPAQGKKDTLSIFYPDILIHFLNEDSLPPYQQCHSSRQK